MYPPKTFAQVEQPFFKNIYLPEPRCVLRFNQFGGGSLPFLIEIFNRPAGTGWFASWGGDNNDLD